MLRTPCSALLCIPELSAGSRAPTRRSLRRSGPPFCSSPAQPRRRLPPSRAPSPASHQCFGRLWPGPRLPYKTAPPGRLPVSTLRRAWPSVRRASAKSPSPAAALAPARAASSARALSHVSLFFDGLAQQLLATDVVSAARSWKADGRGAAAREIVNALASVQVRRPPDPGGRAHDNPSSQARRPPPSRTAPPSASCTGPARSLPPPATPAAWPS